MNDELRASAVQKLRALADQLEAGGDPDGVYYAYDPDCGRDVYPSAKGAIDTTEGSLERYRDAASDGWRDDMEQLEWGIILPVQVCRLVSVTPTPSGAFAEEWDYAMVDPANAAR